MYGRDNETRGPTGRATISWWRKQRCIDIASPQQPRGDRIRVPHLARTEFVSTPHGRGYQRNQIEESLRAIQFCAEVDRRHGRGLVGEDAVAPPSDLVAKDPKPTRPLRSYGALGHHASTLWRAIWDRRHLDDEASFENGDD